MEKANEVGKNDFQMILSELTNEVILNQNLTNSIYRSGNTLKSFGNDVKKDGEEVSKKGPDSVVELIWEQIEIMRRTNIRLEEVASHLESLVG